MIETNTTTAAATTTEGVGHHHRHHHHRHRHRRRQRDVEAGICDTPVEEEDEEADGRRPTESQLRTGRRYVFDEPDGAGVDRAGVYVKGRRSVFNRRRACFVIERPGWYRYDEHMWQFRDTEWSIADDTLEAIAGALGGEKAVGSIPKRQDSDDEDIKDKPRHVQAVAFWNVEDQRTKAELEENPVAACILTALGFDVDRVFGTVVVGSMDPNKGLRATEMRALALSCDICLNRFVGSNDHSYMFILTRLKRLFVPKNYRSRLKVGLPKGTKRRRMSEKRALMCGMPFC